MSISNVIKIGFCDSGVGGLILAFDFIKYILPVLTDFNKKYNIGFEFYHICEGFPYGNKSDEEIIVTGSKMIHRLQRKIGCDILVVGCNTLSAKLDLYNIYFESYRYSTFKVLPIAVSSSEGIYDLALKNSIKYNTKNIEIMMMATVAAFRNNVHEKYIRYAHHRAKKNKITNKNLIIKSFAPDIFWQQNVEFGTTNNSDNLENVKKDIYSFLNNGNFENLNALGLFCTHYPAYQTLISDIMVNAVGTKNVAIVSQGKLIAKGVIDSMLELFPEYELSDKTDDNISDMSFVKVYSLYKNNEYSNTIKQTITDIFGNNMSSMICII